MLTGAREEEQVTEIDRPMTRERLLRAGTAGDSLCDDYAPPQVWRAHVAGLDVKLGLENCERDVH